MKLTKTDYLIYRDCAKNAWFKIHRPDIYFKKELSEFDKGIIETGNDVDKLARDLFRGGVLIEDRDAKDETMDLINSKTKVIYQPVFETEFYKVVCDILVWDSILGVYDLYEVKASNNGDDKKAKDKLYSFDIAFQYLVLKDAGVPLGSLFLVRFNNEYKRGDELDIDELFIKEDFTEKVMETVPTVLEEMKVAQEFLSQSEVPFGNCKCILRGRSSHCTTFKESNPEIPDYGVHDISRIGMSKKKLADLVDSKIFEIVDVPDDFPLSEKQKNQVEATKTGKVFIDKKEISEFLDTIKYPISFLDYETFAAGIPRFFGFSPFNQIVFQFSVHILENENTELKHDEFIFTEGSNPDEAFILALKEKMPNMGSVIVWNKSFEMGRNRELGNRNIEHKAFLDDLNSRMIDLMDIFSNQYFIDPKFKGKTSIKYILPALSNLSYKDLDIKEGATASNTWNKIVKNEYEKEEREEKTKQMLTYCEQDTLAMYLIWKYLKEI